MVSRPVNVDRESSTQTPRIFRGYETLFNQMNWLVNYHLSGGQQRDVAQGKHLAPAIIIKYSSVFECFGSIPAWPKGSLMAATRFACRR